MDATFEQSPDGELLAAWRTEQREYARRAIFEDHELTFSLSSDRQHNLDPVFQALKYLAGSDISFAPHSPNEGIAVLVVLSLPELEVVHTISKRVVLEQPYKPGFLGFREAGPVLDLLKELEANPLAPRPQVLFIDGNGRLHPRSAGSAVIIGVRSGLPTLGVAKEFHPLTFDGEDNQKQAAWMKSQKAMKEHARQTLQTRGDTFPLFVPGVEEPVAAAVLTSPAEGTKSPVFVSPGHRLSLETSIHLALLASRHARVPEPIRQADLIGASRPLQALRWEEKAHNEAGRELVRQTWPS